MELKINSFSDFEHISYCIQHHLHIFLNREGKTHYMMQIEYLIVFLERLFILHGVCRRNDLTGNSYNISQCRHIYILCILLEENVGT